MNVTTESSKVAAVAACFGRHGHAGAGVEHAPGLDLSPENVSRALRAYEQVRQENRRAFLISRGDVSAREVALSDTLGVLAAPYGKSSLLRRLLEGKRPLREPAPTAMSYPAYAFVEENKTFRVSISCFGAADEIVIDQCRYRVVSRNAAARTVSRLLKSESAFDGAAFVAAVKKVPAWTVRFGRWPAWELTVGVQDAGVGRRDSIEKRAAAPVQWADVCWGGWGPVTEIPRADADSDSADGPNSLTRAQAALASIPELRDRSARGEKLSLADLATLNFEAAFERDVAAGLANPRNLDWITYRQEGWVLRRSAEWTCSGPIEIYLDPTVDN